MTRPDGIQWISGPGGVKRAVPFTPRHYVKPTADQLKPNPVRQVEQLLTVNEVAAEMRVSRQTVYRLVEAGDIESRRVGRSIRIPAAAVDRYFKGERQ